MHPSQDEKVCPSSCGRDLSCTPNRALLTQPSVKARLLFAEYDKKLDHLIEAAAVMKGYFIGFIEDKRRKVYVTCKFRVS